MSSTIFFVQKLSGKCIKTFITLLSGEVINKIYKTIDCFYLFRFSPHIKGAVSKVQNVILNLIQNLISQQNRKIRFRVKLGMTVLKQLHLF